MSILKYVVLALVALCSIAEAQTLTASNVQIEWAVVNRFRLFKDPAFFKKHETAWRQYLIHIDNLKQSDEEKKRLIAQTSVVGTEHVLNDRFIPFTKIGREKYDWRGWAAQAYTSLCYDEKIQSHSACGGVASFVKPQSHAVSVSLRPLSRDVLINEFNCEWRVDNEAPVTAPCDEATTLDIPYPAGAVVSVNVPGEQPLSLTIKVQDLLIAGLGDSFASGEGNPDEPAKLSSNRRDRNVLPGRATNDVSSNAEWIDEKCHRSLYGYQMRAALQIAVEMPHTAVTFLGYSCSGATVDEGILGPQDYVDYVSDGEGRSAARSLSGGRRDVQMYRLLKDICATAPEQQDGLWRCPENSFHRNLDYVFVSVGGNDIGFSNLVAWATLRDGTSAALAKVFGATVSAQQFGANMQEELPGIYGRLAKALETALPLAQDDPTFDASRVILTAYPDILEDENGDVCAAGNENEDEDAFAVNQSLNAFSSWLVVTQDRLAETHDQLAKLHGRMSELAEDHGWTFAARSYADRAFRGHGFCAQNRARLKDPVEQLLIPCWTSPDAKSCSSSLFGGDRVWSPYDPLKQHFPYALRQRWVRTINDVFLVMNQKVTTRDGKIDSVASAQVFAETTGAMHPTAEGHAAMADALLLDLRAKLGTE